jgi:hypothetical protein
LIFTVNEFNVLFDEQESDFSVSFQGGEKTNQIENNIQKLFNKKRTIAQTTHIVENFT